MAAESSRRNAPSQVRASRGLSASLYAAVLTFGIAESGRAQAWFEEARLTLSEPLLFAQSASISGSQAVVGGHTGRLHFDPGAVVIFEENEGDWRQAAALGPDDSVLCGLEGCSFGAAVALEGDRLAVGAPFKNRVFLFDRSEGWRQSAILHPEPPSPRFGFGTDVDLENARLVVGAPNDNRAYIFDLVNGSWNQTAELEPSVVDHVVFGESVALSGDRLLVGAHLEEHDGYPGAGAAYVFELSGGSWKQTAKLTASDAQARAHFGLSVALDGDYALVGAAAHDQADREDAGAAYLFERVGDNWIEADMLAPGDVQPHARFGESLSMSGTRAVIAAPHSDQSAGEAYVFERTTTGSWNQSAELPLQGFGGSGRAMVVALDGDRAIVAGGDQASIFAIGPPSQVPGDYDGDTLVDQADLDLVLVSWGDDAAFVPDTWTTNRPSGIVDQAELDDVLLHWGPGALRPASPAAVASAVPEPPAATLLLICLVAVYRRLSVKLRRSLWCVTLLAVTTAESHGEASTRLIGLAANFESLAPFTSAHLVEIDKQTGNTTQLGSDFILEEGFGANLAADSSGRLYNLFSHYSNGFETEGWLNQLNPSTGEVVNRTPFEKSNPFVPFVISDITFNSQDRLVAELITSNPVVDAAPTLSEIDPLSGDVVRSITIRDRNYRGLAFDPDDNLYATAIDVGLVQIDPLTAEETIIGGDLADYGSELPLVDISLAFDRDGTLYATADRLLIVDPTTGDATPVGDAYFEPYSIVGLTVIPEPASCLILAIVGCAFVGVSIRRNKHFA